jgi:cytochrome bd-type quinol oxidase subunit 2
LLFKTLDYAQGNMLILLTATASLGVLTSYFSIYMLERPLSWHDRPKSTLAGFPAIIIVMLFWQILPYQEISRSLALVHYELDEAVMSISTLKIFAIGQIVLWALLLGIFVFSYAKVLRQVKSQKP